MIICDICEKEKNNIEYRPNPYSEDIYGDKTSYYICDECYEDLCDDI